jgi:Fe-S cluster assembly protein SufD
MNVEVRPIKTAAETALATNFAMAKRALPGAPVVVALREDAFRRFESEGLPHRRVEEWKYTDLRALMRDAKPLAACPMRAAKARARAGAACWRRSRPRIVFVDGAFVPELSDLAGLEAASPSARWRSARVRRSRSSPIGKLVPTDDVAVALNTAFMGDGA